MVFIDIYMAFMGTNLGNNQQSSCTPNCLMFRHGNVVLRRLSNTRDHQGHPGLALRPPRIYHNYLGGGVFMVLGTKLEASCISGKCCVFLNYLTESKYFRS